MKGIFEMINVLSWEDALSELKQGNKRFLDQLLVNGSTSKQLLTSFLDGQAPHSVVLTCSDSRVSPDIIFDEHLGDLFVIENAGNVADDTAIGSIQFAIETLNTKLIVVMGHSFCGAVTAASQNDHVEGKLQTIIDRIKPYLHHDCSLEENCKHNARAVAQHLREVPELIREGVKVIAAYYDVVTGVVTFEL